MMSLFHNVVWLCVVYQLCLYKAFYICACICEAMNVYYIGREGSQSKVFVYRIHTSLITALNTLCTLRHNGIQLYNLIQYISAHVLSM